MNREEFEIKMKQTMESQQYCSSDEIKYFVKKAILVLDQRPLANFRGFHNILIVIEELNELIHELTNYMLGIPSLIGIKEELADVILGFHLISNIYNIPMPDTNDYVVSGDVIDEKELTSMLISNLTLIGQLLTKSLRNNTINTDNLYVYIENSMCCINTLCNMTNISKDELQAGIFVKLHRCIENLDDSHYN